MMPASAVTLLDCTGASHEVCAYVAAVTAGMSDDGSTMIAKVTAVVSGAIGFQARTLVFDETEYTVFATKQVPSACTTKVEAFRVMLRGCDVCDGVAKTLAVPESCDEDSTDSYGALAVRFSARHISTDSRRRGDIVSHTESYELMFEGSPELTTDMVIDGCDKLYKIREIRSQSDIRRPMRVLAEVSTRPRANIR
jgi:hypothetical protein